MLDLDLRHVVDVARPALLEYIKRYLRSRVRLLIVVDTEISLSPGDDAFGIERVIRLMRETTVGCMRFHVDVALRSPGAFNVVAAPAGTEPKYTGFRFNSTLANGSNVIDHYDEIWCFGFKPHAGFFPPTNDADIDAAGALPATDAELNVLTKWMDNKGGLFATGDHDFVGASMCSRIPRVGTMRAWTNAQNVPPISGLDRVDTNRPANSAELAGLDEIEFERQSDAVPQRITWVPWMTFSRTGFRTRRRPHPVLCHPRLGPINVMPDHPHEGVVFDHVAQPDVGLGRITLTNTYDFGGGVTGDEYPTVGGVQPLPMVIAHGRTLADPPVDHEKGDSPAKRFAMISVYDGHRIDIGRVATDSTWHHWMNINITQIEAAGGDNWEKIKRYFLNLGVWLAPPHIPRHCLQFHVLESFYSYPGIEEFHFKAPLLELGYTFRHYLISKLGPCWVTQSVLDYLGTFDRRLRERIIDRYLTIPEREKPFPPRPNPCLTCPSPDLLEAAVLGGMIRSASEVLHKDRIGIEGGLKRIMDLNPERFEDQLMKGAASGLKELQAMYANSVKETKQMFG
ncbi:MAG TPA: hypothetical protein VFR78_00775 [Pyrinomonadaceae bacterium]|nr:hypothetical protein [Pyrinomonadaceae bacterium]